MHRPIVQRTRGVKIHRGGGGRNAKPLSGQRYMRTVSNKILPAAAIHVSEIKDLRPVSIRTERGPEFHRQRRTAGNQSARQIDIAAGSAGELERIVRDHGIADERTMRHADGIPCVGGKTVAMRQRRLRVGQILDFRTAQRPSEYTERTDLTAEQRIGRPLAFTQIIILRQGLPRTNREIGIGANRIAVQIKQSFRAVERDGNMTPRAGRHGAWRHQSAVRRRCSWS